MVHVSVQAQHLAGQVNNTVDAKSRLERWGTSDTIGNSLPSYSNLSTTNWFGTTESGPICIMSITTQLPTFVSWRPTPLPNQPQEVILSLVIGHSLSRRLIKVAKQRGFISIMHAMVKLIKRACVQGAYTGGTCMAWHTIWKITTNNIIIAVNMIVIKRRIIHLFPSQ